MNAQERAALVALVAAQQFLDPDVERGPESDGWQNTVTVVRDAIAALSALPSGETEGWQPITMPADRSALIAKAVEADDSCISAGGAEGRTREQVEALPIERLQMIGGEWRTFIERDAVLALYAEPATEPTP